MKIILGEHDGVIQPDGVPTMVVVTASKGSKQITFPVSASNSIASLYVSAAIALGSDAAVPMSVPEPRVPTSSPHVASSLAQKNTQVPSSGIQSRDIVEYIGKESEESPDLIPGNLYRVLEMSGSTCHIIDDNSPNPFRLVVLKTDVRLSRKADPLPDIQKVKLFERITKCPTCLDEVSAHRAGENNFYLGSCSTCGIMWEEALNDANSKKIIESHRG